MAFEKGMSETKKKFLSFRQLINETNSLVNRYVFLPVSLESCQSVCVSL